MAICLASSAARADDDGIDDAAYLIPHPHDTRWWVSGQLNSITQVQPGFHAPYAGVNSFRASDHVATSVVATVYAAYQITSTTAIMIAGESAGGGGLSDALGIAGFTNLDVVRNPTLGPTPYLGRALLEQIIPLSDETTSVSRAPFNVNRKVATRRIAIRAGKLSTVDSFDENTVGTDSHLQLMNWALANNGAYDYAADTRGYTLGAVVEYVDPRFAVRYGAMLMPTVANGIAYDFGIGHARGEQLELELHGCLGGYLGIARILGFYNHAKMGNYSDVDAEARAGIVPIPDITADRVAGRTKLGVGLNLEQQLPAATRAFARLGWADGKNEAFAYTEIDNTVALGVDLRLRATDRLGVAAVSNGLSASHRQYLELGGSGFLLGDGKLHYGRETIVETYYTTRAYRGISPSVDVQLVIHPGYNVERGPAVVGSFRLHLEL